MTINTYLFVSSFIDLNTAKTNFYLRVIIKVSAFCIHSLTEMQCSLVEKSRFESDLGLNSMVYLWNNREDLDVATDLNIPEQHLPGNNLKAYCLILFLTFLLCCFTKFCFLNERIY